MSIGLFWGLKNFVRTNVHGTLCLLNETRQYYNNLPGDAKTDVSLPACLNRRGLRLTGAK